MSMSKQFIRYCVVGLGSNLVAYIAFFLLTRLQVEPKIAMTCVYGAAATLGFWLNRKWTFSHDGRWFYSAAQYAAAQLAGYLLNLAILLIFRDRLHFSAELVQACAIPVVAGFLFVVLKLLVFRSTTTIEG